MPPAPEFLATFSARKQCFNELLALSQLQSELVDSGAYSQLLGLLGGKQQILGRLEAIGKGRPRLWDEWRSERERLAGPARQACEEVLAETEAVLARLLEHERLGTEKLARRRDQTAHELRTVAAGARVNQAYRDTLAPVTHRLLNTDL